MKILDGKKLSEKIKGELKNKIFDPEGNKKIFAKIGVILIGENPASKIYVKYKEKFANEIGIEFEKFLFDEKISEKIILDKIEELNKDEKFTGIFVQLPIPDHISVKKIIEKISPKKDIDGFCPKNIGEMFLGNDEKNCILPATPKGILRILDEYGIDLEGKNAVVIGRSNIVGKPISTMLLNRGATVTTCHSKTKNLDFYTKNADLIISAVGRENFLNGENIKEGVVIIDVGINPNSNLEIKSQIVGDCNFGDCGEKASFITPVPGGVGPMTIASLMENAVKLGKKNKKIYFKNPKKGELWLCDFGNNIGSEQNGVRPGLILNNKSRKEKTCIIIPCSNTKRNFSIKIGEYNFLIHQIKTVDTSRLLKIIDKIKIDENILVINQLCNFINDKLKTET